MTTKFDADAVVKPSIAKISLDEAMNTLSAKQPSAAVEKDALVIRIPLDPKRISGSNEQGDYSFTVLAEMGEATLIVPCGKGTARLTIGTRADKKTGKARASISLTV